MSQTQIKNLYKLDISNVLSINKGLTITVIIWQKTVIIWQQNLTN